MTDIMLDLETLGTRPGCVIRSIGACTFNPNGEGTGAEFYVNVSEISCGQAGLTVDPKTAEWWSKQSKEAQDALLVDQKSLSDALWSFTTWFHTHGGERVWSHGANFDQPILEAAYVAEGSFPIGAPWSYWSSRCTRTLFDVAQVDTKAGGRRGGVHHNALDDAKFQALSVQAAMRRIFKPDFISKTQGVFS